MVVQVQAQVLLMEQLIEMEIITETLLLDELREIITETETEQLGKLRAKTKKMRKKRNK